MNKYMFACFCVLAVISAEIITTKEIESKVASIQAPRVGIINADMIGLKDPFLYLDRNKTTGTILPEAIASEKKDVDLNLSGVMNGKAFVNNSWISVGEKVSGYTLTSIDKNSVVFAKEDIVKRIFANKNRENIIKLQKGYVR